MATSIEVLLAPAEFAALPQRDLRETVCVVFDILRATTTMMTALASGAAQIIPVAEISDALEIRRRRPDVLLAGERNGVRIRADQAGGIDFDLGNSPREFVAEMVAGRTIVMTTTNGTRALQACTSASRTLIGSFLGLQAVARWLENERPDHLLLVGSGTVNQASYEDTLAAGALCDMVWRSYASGAVADSAQMARQLYQSAQEDLLGAIQCARNARRLLGHPELREDVPACLRRDTLHFVAGLLRNGAVGKLARPQDS